MIKKLFLTVMTASALFFVSCSNTKDEKAKEKGDKEIVNEDDNKGKDDGDNSDLGKAATAFCDCFNENMPEVNSKMKKILMKAANSQNPTTALQNELMKIEDEQERADLAQEFQQWGENKEMEECSDKIKAKYDIKDNDPKTQKAILKKLEDNGDCTFLAAMLKMAMKMKGDTNNDGENDREE